MRPLDHKHRLSVVAIISSVFCISAGFYPSPGNVRNILYRNSGTTTVAGFKSEGTAAGVASATNTGGAAGFSWSDSFYKEICGNCYPPPISRNAFRGFGTTQTLPVAGPYSFSFFQLPGTVTGPDIAVAGINDDGVAVGTYQDSNNVDHGFLLLGSSPVTIDAPGALNTFLSAINNKGVIVGTFFSDAPIGFQGLVTSVDGGFSVFDCNDSNGNPYPTNIWGINDSGEIVGYYLPVLGQRGDGFVANLTNEGPGNCATIDSNLPGACLTFPAAINNAGQIVGTYDVVDSSGDNCGFTNWGFLLSDGFSQIAVPDSLSSEAWGINNNGEIIGNFNEGTPFLRLADGTFSAIPNPPNGTIGDAWGINGLGQVIGPSSDGLYIATPQQPDQLNLTAVSGQTQADGIQTDQITATVLLGNDPVAGELVQLTNDGVPGTVRVTDLEGNPTDTIVTNSDGEASFLVSSTQIGLVNFIAQDAQRALQSDPLPLDFYDGYSVELKAWIPQAAVVDPLDPSGIEFPTIPPFPICYHVPPGKRYEYRTTFRGDKHAGYDGSFRVSSEISFHWDGAEFSDVQQRPNSQDYGVTFRDFRFRVPRGIFCSESGEAVEATSASVDGAAKSFQLGLQSANPLVPLAPTIDSELTGDFKSAYVLSFSWLTDLFPSHGFQVIRNGQVIGTDITMDASCVKVLGVRGAANIADRLNLQTNHGTITFDTKSPGQSYANKCRAGPL